MQKALEEGLTDDCVKRICDELAPALAAEGLPILSKEQQRGLLEAVIRVLLSPEVKPMLGLSATRKASHGLDSILD